MTMRSLLLLGLLCAPACTPACAATMHAVEPAEPAAVDLKPAEPELAALSVSLRVSPSLLVGPSRQTLRSMVAGFYAATASRFTTLPTSLSIAESLDAMPVIGTVRRRAGRRFNTDDASMDDFAICYRLSSRLGFQLIPGDPAPVKLAVTSIANNAGVTVGMTWKLSRH